MYKNELAYIGDISQVFNVKNYRLQGGRQEGVLATDIFNGSGLSLTVLPDRGMDIAQLSFKGINYSYINPCGIVSSTLFDPNGVEFFRSFTAGFLTTCGMGNVGLACVDDNQSYGLHGRISNTPAEFYSAKLVMENENPVAVLSGSMREFKFFKENLVLHREIQVKYYDNKILITDTVENQGYDDSEYMLLYHFNLGYPFLSEHCRLLMPFSKTIARDEDAEKGLDAHNIVSKPKKIFREQVFYHSLTKDDEGKAKIKVENLKLKVGFAMKFDHIFLPELVQWNNFKEGSYVMGLEPSTNKVYGRSKARENNTLKTVTSHSSTSHQIELDFFEL